MFVHQVRHRQTPGWLHITTLHVLPGRRERYAEEASSYAHVDRKGRRRVNGLTSCGKVTLPDVKNSNSAHSPTVLLIFIFPIVLPHMWFRQCFHKLFPKAQIWVWNYNRTWHWSTALDYYSGGLVCAAWLRWTEQLSDVTFVRISSLCCFCSLEIICPSAEKRQKQSCLPGERLLPCENKRIRPMMPVKDPSVRDG